MKRWIAAVLATFLVLALVSGCAQKPAEEPAAATPASQQEPAKTGEQPAQNVTVTHWQHHDDARKAVLEELAKDFNAANPNITIDFQTIPYGEYFDKLLSALSAGSGPDVFQIPLTMSQEMIASGRLAPLPDSVITLKQAEEMYIPWTIELAQKDGQLYGLPTDVQTLVMFINNDLAVAAGLDPSRPPTTWAELVAQAEQATKRDANGIVQAGLDTRYNWADFNLFLIQSIDPVVDFAARKVNYDSPAGMEAWKMVSALMVEKKVDSPQFMTGQTKWEQARAVFYINHPVARRRPAIAEAPFKWSIALPPKKDASAELQIPGHSWLYVLNRDAKDQQAAARWVQYLASEPAVKKWATKAGDLPSLKSLQNSPELISNAQDRLVIESLQYAVPVRQAGGKDVDDIRKEIWDSIVIGGVSVEDAVRQGAAAENEVMQRKLK